jgi:hypothetical protein
MLKRDIKLGDKFGSYTVISEPFSDGAYRKIKCQCQCGHIKIAFCGNIKRLTFCRKCSATKIYRKYVVGNKKHCLTFVRYLDEKYHNGKLAAEVRCDCGNLVIIQACLFGKYKTCGCIRLREGVNNPCYKGCDYVSKTYFTLIKSNAIKKNTEFNIGIEFLNDLLIKQNHRCALTNLPIKIGSSKTETTASVDRIDSNKGYIVENVQWVHKDINRMKSDFDVDYFIFLCNQVKNTWNK